MPSKAQLREDWKNAGENVVVLHMFSRGRDTPNPSPFPIKLETYLRIAGIKYIEDFTQPMSSKGKTPWITFNGYEIADSQLCLEHLTKVLGKDLSAHLTDEQRAIEKAMKSVMEDNLYFCLVMEKWAFGSIDDVMKGFTEKPLPDFLFKVSNMSTILTKLAHNSDFHMSLYVIKYDIS